ncbi:MAG TPA: cytosolic protein, partial [Desulfobacterales bacterium]|nr:cytosolic protein [Desulfobacterales bacterium]
MTQHDDYDSPWKEILSTYFEQFMTFFFPKTAQDIDWSRGYDSLDKELRQITREAETGERLADKLFRIWKKSGEETWVLAHVEVQAQEKRNFPCRTFVYNYRIHELYERPVVSLAVLADDNPKWRPTSYSRGLWGCTTRFRFLMVKILSYRRRLKFLRESDNPFAVVVLVHLRTMETKKNDQKRFRYKIELTKELYRRGFSRTDIINLYRFTDW